MKQSKGKKAKRINDLKQSGKISPLPLTLLSALA